MSLALHLRQAVERSDFQRRQGRILAYNGLVVEAQGPDAAIGELCEILRGDGHPPIAAQVVGFRKEHVLLMPYGNVEGLAPDCIIRATGRRLDVPVGDALLGRVVDAFCRPLDDGPALMLDQQQPLHAPPLNPMRRPAIHDVLETGVRAIDSLLPLGRGQRVGVFAGSGVGKSTLLGMLARHVRADVTVLALIGERGREVGDFVRESLGHSGLARSVVMAATADQPALVRTHAVHAAHAVAEYFRDQGKSVLLVVDSMTRFAMAQRDIGLAVGEPPTFRGYTPSVFGWLPRIAERCGCYGDGAITAVYSVLVEGDDMNEPITDHMRAILDGHIVLSREHAERGHYPAIDVLRSVSRLASAIATSSDQKLAAAARKQLALYESSRDMIELGAHQPGVNPALDQAIRLQPRINAVLAQRAEASVGRAAALTELRTALEEGRDHGHA